MHRLLVVLAGLFSLGCQAAMAQEGDPPAADRPRADKPFSPQEMSAFSYVPDETVALLSVRPQAILNHKLLANFPEAKQVLDGAVQQIPVKPQDIFRVTLAIWQGDGHWIVLPASSRTPGVSRRLDSILILQFTKPLAQEDYESKFLKNDFRKASYEGIEYQVKGLIASYRPNPTTLVLAPRDDMEAVLESQARSKPAKIVERTQAKGLNHDVVLALEMSTRIHGLLLGALGNEETAPLLAITSRMERLLVQANLGDPMEIRLTALAVDDFGAKAMASAYDKIYGRLAQQLPDLSRELKKNMGPDLGVPLMKFLYETFSTAKGQAVGSELRVNLRLPPVRESLLQKITVWQKEQAAEAGLKLKLRQIGIASHNYHDVYRKFPFPAGDPQAPGDRQNKLSWRVHLLPYLDQRPLYEKFHLDEAWDSEHNKKLLEQMPDAFKSSPDAKPGYTQFVVPEGERFMADGDFVRRVRDITDGASYSIMVLTVQPDKAEPWTKPGGTKIDPEKAAQVLHDHRKGFLALFADGSVRWLDPKMDAENLKGLLTVNGGERVSY